MVFMLSLRQKQILKTIVEEYIKVAEPVGSKALVNKPGFSIGAPMLRKEMSLLEHEGYLAKPHTSAGRVPTDQAYRLYIQENIFYRSNKTCRTNKASGLTPKETEKVAETLHKKWPDEPTLLKEIARLASEISKDLSVSGTIDGEKGTYTCGFSNLIDEPEFKSFNNINQLMHFMDNVDRHFDELWNRALNESLSVFIGAENLIKEINEFTLITGKYQLPSGDQGFVSVIGPRRMDYKHNMALVEYISNCLNDK